MLHDGALARSGRALDADDRRATPRLHSAAELVVRWHQHPEGLVRYPVLDQGEGGYRIRSGLPLLSGMTGTALRLLPEGRPLDAPVMVVWCRRDPNGAGHDFGLRRIEPI